MENWIVFVVVAVFIVGLILAAVQDFDVARDLKECLEAIPDFTAHHEFMDGHKRAIAIDTERAKLCFLRREGNGFAHVVVDCTDILSAEVFEDGNTVVKTARGSQIGRAIVGGVLLGPVGAVIGGLSGKKVESGKVQLIELRVAIADAADPMFEIVFHSGQEIDRASSSYKVSSRWAQEWHARIKALIKTAERRAENGAQALPGLESAGHETFVDRLSKLADLRDRGVLTPDEFAAQKAKLLADA